MSLCFGQLVQQTHEVQPNMAMFAWKHTKWAMQVALRTFNSRADQSREHVNRSCA